MNDALILLSLIRNGYYVRKVNLILAMVAYGSSATLQISPTLTRESPEILNALLGIRA
jgi:hypothetical protein